MSTKKQRIRVIAVGDDKAVSLVHEAIGDVAIIVGSVDLPRLRDDYGTAVAKEVLRQMVANDPGVPRPAATRKRR